MPIYEPKKRGQPYRVEISYVDEYGKNRKKVICNKKETLTLKQARQVESEWVSKLDTLRTGEEKECNILFDDVCKMFLEEKKIISLNTYETYEKLIRLYMIPFFGGQKISAITPAKIQKWKLWRSEQKGSIKYKNYSVKTLKAVFRYAFFYCGLKSDPSERLENFKGREMKKEMMFYTYEDFLKYEESMIRLSEEDDSLNTFRYRLFFTIAFYTGLRKGENNALQWKDIKDGRFVVSKSISQKPRGVLFVTTPPKNQSSNRTVPICNQVKVLLDKWRKICEENYYGFNEEWYICGTIHPLMDNSLDQFNRKFAKNTGLPRIRVHDFRHSFASLLINQDINIKTISKLMGHATVNETWNRYGHMYPSEDIIAIDTISKLKQ